MDSRIGVVGAGAWGTALANLLAEKGHAATLWAYEPEVVEQINHHRENHIYLPGIRLSTNIQATSQLNTTVANAACVVLVSPSHVLRHIATQIAPYLSRKAIVVNASKGIEVDTGKLLSAVLTEALPTHPSQQFAFLSGPSFAKEVALHRPTAVVVASVDSAVAEQVQTLFRTPTFLTFCHDDIIGVQVGGAVKNILAIATGIVDGLQLGHNTRAALITRGLYEIMKLGRALGANPLTLVGLAGLGDLVLTCTGDLSRNRSVGIAIGEGRKVADVMGTERTIAEGIATTKAVYQLIQRHHLTAPICTAVYQILYEGKPLRQALNELTMMELHEELGSLLKIPGSMARD